MIHKKSKKQNTVRKALACCFPSKLMSLFGWRSLWNCQEFQYQGRILPNPIFCRQKPATQNWSIRRYSKIFFFFFCSDRQHEILQNKYAPTNIYTSRSHRCKSCKPSDNWGGSWKSTLMLTCINKFLVKVKGSIICRQAIQLNEVTMRLKTDNRWINNSKNGLIKILLFHKSSNCLSKCLQVHAQNAILSILVTIFNMWKIYIQLSISRKSPHDTKEPHS